MSSRAAISLVGWLVAVRSWFLFEKYELRNRLLLHLHLGFLQLAYNLVGCSSFSHFASTSLSEDLEIQGLQDLYCFSSSFPYLI